MGGAVSRLAYKSNESTDDLVLTERSKRMDSTELEFKSRLKNGIFIQYIVMFSKQLNNLYLMKIWEVLEEYESTINNAARLLDALCIMLMPRQDVFPMAADFIQLCNNKDTNCHVQERKLFLRQIKRCCFQLMFINIYKPFSATPQYQIMCEYFKDPSKWITHKSFQYLNLLAQGAYGVVVQCRKIRTNQVYAMKIQSKLQLLKQYRIDRNRVTSELEASTVFCHPYVCGIAYALQTETLVMLVSPISGCGDLRRSQSFCTNHCMSLDRVTFYIAEISCALMYMHKHDIMYRDLKPGNVLLNADGHIMLADFGSVSGMNIMLLSIVLMQLLM